ncbi:Ribosome maturation factor RimP [Actinomadura sp. RB68]|uniref:Ribosome maturation factor RimP n=1 Tax=Actinomadura macrotermitis TaxID=2585200 RepID=A0A7K0BP51_9ACTN|nr:Ribosome maturation factor RimP [Actinomadura macrotermitis]
MSVESDGGHAQRGRDGGASRPTRDDALAELTRLLEPAVAAAGFDLEEVDVRPAGRRRLVKIVVDGDGGVSLDDVAELSQTASELLDASAVMGTAPYVLEVTSPGVDRPLTEPRHWRRAAGRLVVAELAEGGQVEGRILAADDEGVELDVVTKPKGKGSAKAATTARRRFAPGELLRGRVQVEFRRPDDMDDDVSDDDADEPAGPAGPGAGGAGGSAGRPDVTRSPAEPE